MNSLRRIADAALFLSFCFLAGSGILMKYSFVKGMGPQSVMGLVKPDWEAMHFWIGIVMAAALVLHLVLNRKWIEKVGAMQKRWLAVLFIALGVAMATLLAAWPTEYGTANAGQAGMGMGPGGGGMAHGRANMQNR